MSAIPSTPTYYTVHTGIWTNWSRGRVLGSTLTLTQRDGTLFIAFIALFVTIVGTCFWRVACYVFHHIYSSEATRDGLHHQRQAILRNSANSVSGLVGLVEAALAWRMIAKRPYHRTMPLILFASMSLLAFTLASGFSSKVSNALGREVLVEGSNCGLLRFYATADDAEILYKTATPYLSERITASSTYAQQCYSDKSDPESCHTFVQPQLPFTIQTNASCPFDESLCLLDCENLILDTGFLNSAHHLGVNAPPGEQLEFRLVNHCAPINITSRQGAYNYTDSDTSLTYRTIQLGKPSPSNASFTYKHPEMPLAKFLDGWNTPGASPDYILGALKTFWYDDTYTSDSDFFPIPELVVPNSDLDLIFLSSDAIAYMGQCDDPWFSAHRATGLNKTYLAANGSIDLFLQDDPVSALGCVAQQQWCNRNLPAGEQCETLRGRYDQAPTNIYDRKEGLYAEWLNQILIGGLQSAGDLIGIFGTSSLKAKAQLFGGYQPTLPSNQWQLEAQNWFAINLALMQRIFVDAATGPSNVELRPFVLPPENSEEKKMCQNQKIRSNEYMNFSVLGLIIIFSIGGATIIASYTVEPFVSWLQKRRHNLDAYSRLEWCTNETLQLQRLAHEELGAGTWSGAAEAIPVTGPDERLAILDLSDPNHPRLKRPPVLFEEELAEACPTNGRTASGTPSSLGRVEVEQCSTKAVSVKGGVHVMS